MSTPSSYEVDLAPAVIRKYSRRKRAFFISLLLFQIAALRELTGHVRISRVI